VQPSCAASSEAHPLDLLAPVDERLGANETEDGPLSGVVLELPELLDHGVLVLLPGANSGAREGAQQ